MTNYNRFAAHRRDNRQIAFERILILFEKARETFKQEPNLAQCYVKLAREIGMRYKVRMPRDYRRLICKNCKSFILPGRNCRVRTQRRREPHLVITCLTCGSQTRIPLKNEQKL